MGVIENDFHNRKDLSPNVCAVYTEEKYRAKGIAGKLLNIVVEDMKDSHDGLSYLLKVKLFTDFGRLNDVRVIAHKGQEELQELEKQVKKRKK